MRIKLISSLLSISSVEKIFDKLLNLQIIIGIVPKLTRKQFIQNIEFQITDHCNLNCKYCNHFSPLADVKFADINLFERDLKRLEELFGNSIKHIALAGGEPLLHTNINEFMQCSRKYFKKASISLITNGILLKKMPIIFWETCRDNNILLEITNYPIKLDLDYISSTAKKYKCQYKLSIARENGMQRLPIDVGGKQSPMLNYYCRCYMSGYCISINEGKIYQCPIAQNMYYLNKRFSLNIPTTNSDYIDIHSISSKEKILDYLSKPIPMCKYCKWKNITFNEKWERTTGTIPEEWIDNDC